MSESSSSLNDGGVSLNSVDSIKTSGAFSFGSFEVAEDRGKDLIGYEERKIFKNGFKNMQSLVDSENSDGFRGLLINTDVASCLVGIQPLVSLYPNEAEIVSAQVNKAGLEDYAFVSSGNLDLMINLESAKHVLRQFSGELGLASTDSTLEKEELVKRLSLLLNDQSAERANLAHGLLSGFPLNDVREFIDRGNLNKVPTVRQRSVVRKIKGKIESFLLRDRPSHDIFDTNVINNSAKDGLGVVDWLGVRWLTTMPPKQETIKHCQKLLQVDRELGLTKFLQLIRISERFEVAKGFGSKPKNYRNPH